MPASRHSPRVGGWPRGGTASGTASGSRASRARRANASQSRPSGAGRAAGGLALLVAVVAVMWIVEVVNTLDSGALDGDGIWARNPSRLWGILTAPFLHASFDHLIANTVPLLFMGVIVAVRGAARLALVAAIIIVVGGLGTWLISPAGADTIGASGVVFGLATYVLARGFIDRSVLELATGLVVVLVWGGALLSSLAPHPGVSWQAHLCGAIAGVLAAWLLAGRRAPGRGSARRRAAGARTPA